MSKFSAGDRVKVVTNGGCCEDVRGAHGTVEYVTDDGVGVVNVLLDNRDYPLNFFPRELEKIEDRTSKPLVFVQHAFGNKFDVYQDGKKLEGVRSIHIKAGYAEATTHEIEFVTGMTASGALD